MKKYYKMIIVSVVSFALAFSFPLAQKETKTQAKQQAYKLVWSDEFDGDSLNMDNWTAEVGTGPNRDGWGNNERQYYTGNSENLDISNGTLKIHALRQSIGNRSYTSSRIITKHKKFFTYGKFEARMKLPSFKGAWPAFWTLGEDIDSVGWPKCGEMDIMEAINTSNLIYSNLHWSKNNKTTDTTSFGYYTNDRTDWHTYAMEWEENYAKFLVDGVETRCFDITLEDEMEEFRQDQFIILNLAVGGNWPENSIQSGTKIDDTAFPDRSTMEVDYVRVYQLADVEPTTAAKKSTPAKKNTTKKATKLGKTKIKKVARKKKSLKLTLKKIKGASGYSIKISDQKNFDGYWTKNTKKTKVKLKGLDRKTKYYMKARAYKKVGSSYIYGKYSAKKTAKTK